MNLGVSDMSECTKLVVSDGVSFSMNLAYLMAYKRYEVGVADTCDDVKLECQIVQTCDV